MKAVVICKPGGVEALQVLDVATPTAGKGEVLVRVVAAGLNPIDTKVRANGGYGDGSPFVPGCDGTGEVVAIGDGVDNFKMGDAVLYYYGGIGMAAGNYAEYTVVPAWALVKKPDSMSFAEAAALPLAVITAWESLFCRTLLKKGQDILIQGGSGGVGHFAVQLAASVGARVLTTASTEKKAQWLKELGAAVVIPYKDGNLTDEVMQVTQQQGVDIALDTVGGPATLGLIPLIKPYGDLISLLIVPDNMDWAAMRMRNIRFGHELMLTPAIMQLTEASIRQTAMLEKCVAMVAAGILKINVEREYALDQVGLAHQTVEAGGVQGKLVLNLT